MLPSFNLQSSVRFLKGVGPRMAQRLRKLEIETIWDLLVYYPFRYKNYALTVPISTLQEGETVTIKGEVKEIKNEYRRNGKKIQRAIIGDKSGELQTIWFNRPFLVKTLPVGQKVALSGRAKEFRGKLTLVAPEYEIIAPEQHKTIHTGRLVPVYQESAGINSRYLRKLIAQTLPHVKEKVPEIFPAKTLIEYQLLPRREAIEKIHFPESKVAAQKARERLAFEEMFLIQLQALTRRYRWQRGKRSFPLINKNIKPFLKKIPFELTRSQKQSIKEIVTDFQKTTPMNRLLQGDVGSGKTVVAATAAYLAVLNGYQVALMAPTEILAFQHYQTFKKLFAPFAMPIELISGSRKIQKRKVIAKVTIGTHALLHRQSIFKNLGLVVIDEQHRFGVVQRGQLVRKAVIKQNFYPHLLTMTATPIPRTITLTLHGNLDLSLITQMPPGRQTVATFVIPPEDREKCYSWLKNEIRKKKVQVFIICPFIEPSETMETVKAAKEEFVYLRKEVFLGFKLALLHGRIAGREKEKILKQMQKKIINVLVSTPVVEVGIDIANATIIIIEDADRFGLAQLHQLRGRVGRGKKKSYCLLFAENPGKKAITRLGALEKIHQGLRLAELDLKLRGPGEIYGLKQHGFPKLKLADINDLELIKKARKAAEELISDKSLPFSLAVTPPN